MPIKFDGLQKLQRELNDFQRAINSLGDDVATLTFDADEPASVQAAIRQIEGIIDDKVRPYRGNKLVAEIAEKMKTSYREQIEETASANRNTVSRILESEMSESSVLRQIDNAVSDIKWATYQSFPGKIKKLSRLLHSSEVKAYTEALCVGVDLESWLKTNAETQGGMVGSARIELPESREAELGTVIQLIDKFAASPDEATDFAFTFFYQRNNITDNLQTMIGQLIVPFGRDYIDFVKERMPAPPAEKVNSIGQMSKKVFLVHGHDNAAKQEVARFLEKLGFEPIILSERPNQGKTLIEKFETHADVGFAVVLMTPDDEGGAKGAKAQPRARQNVLLELGYFIGRLGRHRVCALKRGDIEFPSDYAGVVYEELDAGGAWKAKVGLELEAAGYSIDWNMAMRP